MGPGSGSLQGTVTQSQVPVEEGQQVARAKGDSKQQPQPGEVAGVGRHKHICLTNLFPLHTRPTQELTG